MNWANAHEAAKAKVVPQQVNPTVVTQYARKDFARLCKLIEKTYSDLAPSEAAVAAAGIGRDGDPIKMAVYTRKAGNGLKASNVTLYCTGKAVWTNLEPVAL